jgi:DNA-binding NtrC family response regulator
VGSRKKIPIDVRIIAATNKDLEEEIGKAGFRKDLFYRLNVVTLHVPPLRERKDDIPLLVNFFLQQSISRLCRQPMRFSPDAMQTLVRYPWPGNVRELENEVERAVALAYHDEIAPEDLSPAVTRFGAEHRAPEEPLSVKGAEKDLIEKALQEAGGNKTKAAGLLGLSREGLRRKMNRYGM